MRIRTIKPEFFTHEVLFELEQETGLPVRLAFIGLWCAADREGRFKWQPRRLKAAILPYDEVDFSRVLDALCTRGMIVKYASGPDLFGFIRSFLSHQVINNRESRSILPTPPEGIENEHDQTRLRRVDDASATPLVHASGEGKGKEGNGKELSPLPPAGDEGGIPSGASRWDKSRQKNTKATACPEGLSRICAWFGRRSDTMPSVAEVLAFRRLSTTPAEMDGMEGYYSADIPEADWRRRDVLTLLNNWESELDRARKFYASQR